MNRILESIGLLVLTGGARAHDYKSFDELAAAFGGDPARLVDRACMSPSR